MLCIPCPHYGSLCFWLLWGLVTSKFSVSRHCKAYILYRARKGWEDSVMLSSARTTNIYAREFNPQSILTDFCQASYRELGFEGTFILRTKSNSASNSIFHFYESQMLYRIFCYIPFMILFDFLPTMHQVTKLHICQVLFNPVLSQRQERCMSRGSCLELLFYKDHEM